MFDDVPGRNDMPQPMLALFNLGGGEIVLILILLAMLVIALREWVRSVISSIRNGFVSIKSYDG
jgi:hypothetical protein